jgi:thioredoxin reductase (NADPH)
MLSSDVAIIGAGPAGLATALQLRRYAIHPLLFECNRIGGLLWNANLVENYPGFPGGISGAQLVERFIEQVKYSNIEVIGERVHRLSYTDNLFQVETDQQDYRACVVVIASGTKPKVISGCNIPTELSDRVFYEVFPLFQVKQCRIAIIGAGDAAFDYALNLAPENEVVILNRGEKAKCLPLLWERISSFPGIIYHPNTRLAGLYKSEPNKITIECIQSHQNLTFQADYLLYATGREPQLNFLSLLEQIEIERLEKIGRLYFVGDVKNGIYRQTAIAVGDGIMTAMKIYRTLEGTIL